MEGAINKELERDFCFLNVSELELFAGELSSTTYGPFW